MYIKLTCPAFLNLEAIQPSTALSTFAESNTINGALPPSSRQTLLIVEADCSNRIFPTAVEPVNERALTSGDWHKVLPTLEVLIREVGTTLMTPFGKPASSASFAIASAE